MVPGFGNIANLCTILEAGSTDLVQTVEKRLSYKWAILNSEQDKVWLETNSRNTTLYPCKLNSLRFEIPWKLLGSTDNWRKPECTTAQTLW